MLRLIQVQGQRIPLTDQYLLVIRITDSIEIVIVLNLLLLLI